MQGAGTHVLVVDDAADMRRLLDVLLRHAGVALVDHARDGAEALEAARRRAYDLILMDLHMPGLDGAQATAAIVAERPGAHVVAFSSSADADTVDRFTRAGARAAFTKSELAALLAYVRAHLTA